MGVFEMCCVGGAVVFAVVTYLITTAKIEIEIRNWKKKMNGEFIYEK